MHWNSVHTCCKLRHQRCGLQVTVARKRTWEQSFNPTLFLRPFMFRALPIDASGIAELQVWTEGSAGGKHHSERGYFNWVRQNWKHESRHRLHACLTQGLRTNEYWISFTNKYNLAGISPLRLSTGSKPVEYQMRCNWLRKHNLLNPAALSQHLLRSSPNPALLLLPFNTG